MAAGISATSTPAAQMPPSTSQCAVGGQFHANAMPKRSSNHGASAVYEDWKAREPRLIRPHSEPV